MTTQAIGGHTFSWEEKLGGRKSASLLSLTAIRLTHKPHSVRSVCKLKKKKKKNEFMVSELPQNTNTY